MRISLVFNRHTAGGASILTVCTMHPETPAPRPAAKLAAGILLTDVELAELLGASLQTIRNWRWRGDGPRYVKLGGRMVRYRPEDVRAFIEGKAAAA